MIEIFKREMEMNLVHENNNDINHEKNSFNLLELLESINSNGFSEPTVIQSKINLYLKELLQVEYVLTVPVLPTNSSTTSEGLIQVINDNVLEKEFRFSVNIT